MSCLTFSFWRNSRNRVKSYGNSKSMLLSGLSGLSGWKCLTTVEDAVQKVMDEAKAFAYGPENLCTIMEKCYSEEMLHNCRKHWKKFDWDKTLTDQETFVEQHGDFLECHTKFSGLMKLLSSKFLNCTVDLEISQWKELCTPWLTFALELKIDSRREIAASWCPLCPRSQPCFRLCEVWTLANQ